MTHRQLKKQLLNLLRTSDWTGVPDTLCRFPPRQVVNPLFGLLYHGESLVRWRAVSAMGIVAAKLAGAQMEAARIIMRRLMWNLNDESGGMGWGSPEAMGEIMAQHAGLALEYGAILVSYADPKGNFLEHPGLQHGVLWALGRLGRVRPDLVGRAADFIKPHLNCIDPNLRGMAVWALRPFADETFRSMLQPLVQDVQPIPIYIDHHLAPCQIGRLAREALDALC